MKPNKKIEFKIRPVNKKGQHGRWRTVTTNYNENNNPAIVIIKAIGYFFKWIWNLLKSI